MSKVFSEKELEELKESFAIFDRNNSGKISVDELKKILESTGNLKNVPKADEHVANMIKLVDKDGDGQINFSEFCEMMAKTDSMTSPEDEMRAAFRTFDIDGDGVITREELEIVMRSIEENITDQELINVLSKDNINTLENDLNKILLDLEIYGLIHVTWITKDKKRIEIVNLNKE